jgi:hypothetical protein
MTQYNHPIPRQSLSTNTVDFDDAPVFDVDTNDHNIEPVFDEMLFDDPEPYSDDLGSGLVFDMDINDQPVFNTRPLLDCVATTEFEFAKPEHDAEHAMFDIEGDPLLDKEPEIEEAELIPDQAVIGVTIASPATSINAPSTCSTKCLHLAVTTDLVYSEMKAGPRYSLRVPFKTYCSSLCNSGELLLNEVCRVLCDCELLIHGISTSFFIDPGLAGLVISASVATARFECKYWDPGLAGVARVMNCTSSCVGLHWDPGSSEGLKFTRIGADFDPAHHHELYMDQFASKFWDPGLAAGSPSIAITDNYPKYLHWLDINLLSQQKCSGSYKFDWIMPCGAQVLSNFQLLNIIWLAKLTIIKFGAEKEVSTWGLCFCVAIGLWAGLIIGFVTEYYTSNVYSPVQNVDDSYRTVAALGMLSTTASIVTDGTHKYQ